jgi:uncharacterized protein Usg
MILTFKQKRLVLVGVRYYIPDYTNILNEFYWQTEDFIPDIPRVHQFLDYWKNNIEATIKEVIVSEAVVRSEYTSSQFYKVLN